MGKATSYRASKKYRDKWVAIHNKNVVAANSNLEDVVKEAKRKTGKKEIPVFYVESGSHIYAD
jgi:hypothetical protein